MIECVCPVAGWCERNKRRMVGRLFELCKTRDDYHAAFHADSNTELAEKREAAKNQYERSKHAREELTRALWAELHTKTDPTQEWFDKWVRRVPDFGCKCRSWIKKYLVTNPPRYDDFQVFALEMHNAVNRKLDRKEWTIEESIARWSGSFVE